MGVSPCVCVCMCLCACASISYSSSYAVFEQFMVQHKLLFDYVKMFESNIQWNMLTKRNNNNNKILLGKFDSRNTFLKFRFLLFYIKIPSEKWRIHLAVERCKSLSVNHRLNRTKIRNQSTRIYPHIFNSFFCSFSWYKCYWLNFTKMVYRFFFLCRNMCVCVCSHNAYLFT